MTRTIAIALVLLVSCDKEAPPPAEPVVRPVRFQRVVSSGGARARTFSGQTRSGTESMLSFKVSGGVAAVHVKVGDPIDKGQLIAELDPVDYELQVAEARAGIEQGKAGLRNAEATYSRVRALYENGNASRSDLDGSRAAAEGARAQVRSINKRLQLARNQLEYTRLKAPEAGAVAAVMVEPNENVRAGSPIVKMAGGGRLEVQIAVPEVLIGQVSKGSKCKVKIDAIGDQQLAAEVTEVGVATTFGATTYPVSVVLDGDAPSVRPGMAAEVELSVADASERELFIVPAFAVREDAKGRFVFVAEVEDGELGLARRRAVEVGQLRSDGLELLSGVTEGDRVVTAGVTRIEDGQKVRVLTAHEVKP